MASAGHRGVQHNLSPFQSHIAWIRTSRNYVRDADATESFVKEAFVAIEDQEKTVESLNTEVSVLPSQQVPQPSGLCKEDSHDAVA